MKVTQSIFASLLLSAAACVAQEEITQPGWFNSAAWLEPSTNSSGSGNYLMAAGASISGSSLAVAEATTPEVEALARGLENDPKRIFDFVHDHIRHVFYFGAKKGAQLTLLERSGNDFDQCALLVALLRAAGYSPTYQFGVLQMPIDSDDHFDVRHWLGLSMLNTNWANTQNYFGYILGSRGYPYSAYPSGTNTIAFHRVWVKLSAGSTNYYLDPAFKISEPISGVDLKTAMGLDTNALMTAAAGTVTANYVQNVNEAALRNKLRDFTTNLLSSIQSNFANASVEEILSGKRIVSSADVPLSQSLAFSAYTSGGQLPVVDWDNQPTNLMSKLNISFAGTNYQWLFPQLQGQRLSLSFTTNGIAQLWQEDTLLLQTATSGGRTIKVYLGVNHPHGTWNLGSNSLNDNGRNDQTDYNGTDYQRTNATFALVYAFDMDSASLQKRYDQLDAYRQRGFSDTSREVVTETLNVMGMKWLLQTELMHRMFSAELDMLPQSHHRVGRMAQEKDHGYKIDVGLQLLGVVPASGYTQADADRVYPTVDLTAYFASAMEHGVIEQMQSGNMVAASTVKMLQLGNTNGLKTFLADSNNWSTVSSQLVNYDTAGWHYFITNGFTLLMPENGALNIAGAGSWGGYGVAGIGIPQGLRATAMLIGGGYFGGYGADADGTVDPDATSSSGSSGGFDSNGPFNGNPSGADPVDMVSGAFGMNKKELALGAAEPRGISFSRHYSTNRRFQNRAGMAYGWTHNYFCNLQEISAPELGLGRGTAAQMAPMLVATRSAVELYRVQPSAKNWLVTALIAKWGIDQLLDNSVSIALGNDTVQFIKQPNGTFTPPANCTMTLLKTNSVYWLQQRHEDTFKFNTAGRLTNIVDQYSQSLKLTYGTGSLSNWVTTITDWKNRTFTLSYSGTPTRLQSVSDSTGRSISFGYTTNAGQLDLSSITDAEGKTSTFIYDTNHQVIVTTDANSLVVVSNVYDGFGRVATQYSQGDPNKVWQLFWGGNVNTEQDPTGGKKRFYFDEKGRQIAVEDALGNIWQSVYDGQDHVTMTISPLNETNQFVFDANHNLLQSIDPLGFTNQFFYDTQNNLVRSVDARGNPSRFGYNAKFQITGQTNGAGDWVTFAYNGTDGTLTNRTDSGGSTGYSYDSLGQLNRVTYPGNLGIEGYLNSTQGDVLSRTNARGFITSFQYNSRRELTNTIAPTNVISRITYDAVGNPASTTDARGFTSSNLWSSTAKLLSTFKSGVIVSNTYDARDWLVRSLNPLQQPTFYTNDVAGRLIAVTDPLNRAIRYTVDANGRRLFTTNAALEVSRQEWNARGELTKSADGANHTALRAYDAAGNQIILTNRNGKKWQFQFDGANRLTNTITPLNRQTTLIFDDRGLLKTMREPSQQVTTNFYDAKGRLTNRVDAVASTLFRLDANNNITNVVENGRTNSWTFDAYDRVSSYRDADGNLIQYRYDGDGNLTNLIYPGNRTVTYFYDSLNRLTNVTDWSGRKTSFEYDLASQLRKITRPNNTTREVSYDAAGQTTNIVEKLTNGFPIALFRFDWNNAARMDWEFAGPKPHAYTLPARTMTFDDDNRINTFNGQTVVYDSDGNMTSGPLMSDTLTAYSYDARNRLLGVGGLNYGYDPTGNRVAVTNGATVTRLIVDPNPRLSQVLMRVKAGVTNYYVYGNGLLYEITETAASTNTAYYHFDYRGSTVALTDGTGRPTDRIEYSVYGTTTYRAGTNDTPFLFNGRYGVQTDANGLLYMRARYYNPYICRFINADPSGFSGGLNWYAYADGNPVNYLDPFGLGAGEPSAWSWFTGGLKAIGSGLAQLAGYIWSAPNTAIGLVAGGFSYVAGLVMGTHPEFHIANNAFQFLNLPWGSDESALTLGNTQLYHGSTPDTIGPRYDGGPGGVPYGPHEQAHTYQYGVLGPFFLPAYFTSGGISANNPFEVSADNYSQGVGSWWPWHH